MIVKEAVVCMATIFIRTFGMQLLAKNSNVKESPIQTETIGMQSPLGKLPGICHVNITSLFPLSKNRNEVMCLVIAHGSTDTRQRTIMIRVWKFPSLEVCQQ